MSVRKEIKCTVLDGKYEKDDYKVLIKLIITKPKEYEFFSWDGVEWGSKKALNRVYVDYNAQQEYDDFKKRLLELEENQILYELSQELHVDQSYYFENERIYIYIESIKEE